MRIAIRKTEQARNGLMNSQKILEHHHELFAIGGPPSAEKPAYRSRPGRPVTNIGTPFLPGWMRIGIRAFHLRGPFQTGRSPWNENRPD
jgi:hypothetical protein